MSRQLTDQELKEEFLRNKSVTKCPPRPHYGDTMAHDIEQILPLTPIDYTISWSYIRKRKQKKNHKQQSERN